MPYKLKEKNDIKIYILYLLAALNKPLTHNELNDIVVQDEVVSWFDCAECINELVDTHNISMFYDVKGVLKYTITMQGEEVAHTLQSEISGYVRTQGFQSAIRYMTKEETGEIETVIEERGDGRVCLTLRYIYKQDVIMELNLVAENTYHAGVLQRNFVRDPHGFYHNIMLLLRGQPAQMRDPEEV